MFQEFIKNGLFPGHGQLMNLHIGWDFLTSPQTVRTSYLLPFHQRREQTQRSPQYRKKKPRDPTGSGVLRGKYSGSLDGFGSGGRGAGPGGCRVSLSVRTQPALLGNKTSR